MDQGNSITKEDLSAGLVELRREIVREVLAEIRHSEVDAPQSKSRELRLRSLEARDAQILERLADIEERLLHLHFRRPAA